MDYLYTCIDIFCVSPTLLLVGAAVLAGGYGVKKGIDAKGDFDRAESLNAEAKRIYDDASIGLEKARTSAQSAMDSLGKLKFEIYELRLIPFVEAFSKIKNVDFRDQRLKDEFHLISVSEKDMLAIQKSVFVMKEIVTGGVTALGAGGLAGLAAYGGVGALASTAGGTAIAGLSGVAATNATLAWLGGGALSAGGFGMAGGAAVLGGIVAGPVLAIGGMVMASKAEAAKHDAYANRDKARAAAEQMKTAQVVTQGIEQRFREIRSVLLELNKHFTPLLIGLQNIVQESTDYSSYSMENRKGVMMAAAMAKTLKNVLEAPLLDESGALTAASRNVIQEARNKLLEIESA
jgi:hypothetical protein